MTSSAVLDTVSETALAVSKTVKSVAVGADMLHDFVQHQRYIQLKNLGLAKEFVKEQMITSKMLELDQVLDAAQVYMDADPMRAQRCLKLRDRLEKAWGE
jgi:hypothetical protein